MSGRLLFYAIEAMLLSLVTWVGLALAGRGLRRMGAELRPPRLRAIGPLWIAIAIAGIAGGELIGPEFTVLYYVCGAATVAGLVIWVSSFLGRRQPAMRVGSDQ